MICPADIMNNIHAGHRERLKSRFLSSSGSLDDITVLELLLTYAIPRRDTRPVAAALIEEFGNLQRIADAEITELAKFDGISMHTAMLLKMLPELSKRITPEGSRNDPSYLDTDVAGKFFVGSFKSLRQEYVMMMCITENGKMIDAAMLYRGNINGAGFKIRNITERALMNECHDILLAHNHPHGPMIPSQSDLDSTVRIKASLASNGITLHEHYLVYRDGYMGLISGDYRR